jgi:hypothetical protein
MQCWAHSLGPNIKVVEPFIRRSVLGLDDQHRIQMNDSVGSGHLKSVTLSDVYNRDKWREYTTNRKSYAPLVSWKVFLESCSRKIIVVELACVNHKACMACGDDRTKDLLLSIEVLETRYGFEVVRRVCYPLKMMSSRDFRMLVYQNYSPSEVVVVFNHWGGIESSSISKWRMPISDMHHCSRAESQSILWVPISARIKDDASQYIQKYMSAKQYISVMVRLEYFYLNHNRFKGKSRKEIMSLLRAFYDKIVEKVNEYKADHDIRDVLLTMDCRNQGSSGFLRPNGNFALMSNSISILYKELYGNSSTLEEWDESFLSVTSFRTEGYVAMLQKQLAASGTCLITAGGGGFQRTAIQMYHHYHQTQRCVFKI